MDEELMIADTNEVSVGVVGWPEGC